MKESTIVQQFNQMQAQINNMAGHIQTMAYAIESLAREGNALTRYIISTAKNEDEKKEIMDKLESIRKEIQQELIERVKKESQVRKMAEEMKKNAEVAKTTEVPTPKTEEKGSEEAKA